MVVFYGLGGGLGVRGSDFRNAEGAKVSQRAQKVLEKKGGKGEQKFFWVGPRIKLILKMGRVSSGWGTGAIGIFDRFLLGLLELEPGLGLTCTKFKTLYKMHTLPLSEFRANASAMIDLVEKGETVRILRHGKPVAELVPVKADVPVKVPHWKLPIKPLNFLRPDGKTGAQLIIEERESGW